MKLKPKERILKSAELLFYRDGYTNTTVADLIADSQSHKASFYRHFEDKSDVAVVYLERQGNQFGQFLLSLKERFHDPVDFFDTWSKMILRQIRSKRYFGCPVVSFAASIPITDPIKGKIGADAQKILGDWVAILSAIIARWQGIGAISQTLDAKAAAHKVMRLYQGYAAIFNATSNPKTLEEFGSNASAILSSHS